MAYPESSKLGPDQMPIVLPESGAPAVLEQKS
jgi:hypothetical protein